MAGGEKVFSLRRGAWRGDTAGTNRSRRCTLSKGLPGALFKRAQSANPAVAQAAVRELIQSGRGALPALQEALRERAPQSKLLAIQILGAMGPVAQPAAGDLHPFLRDAYLGQAAADALNRIDVGPVA
jgi:hypothetical protein